MRIGHGYDVHRMAPNRNLILCGVLIPCDLGLLGHSDADVATHALMDAMLGAAALGDIGILFPDSDPSFKNADSIQLLHQVAKLVKSKHFSVSNIDITIIAQAPRLRPFLLSMRQTLAKTLNLSINQISVKATTEEGLGFTGSGFGIAAHCVLLLEELH